MKRAMKRVIDVVVSGSALLVLWPVMAVVALAIRWSEGGPVLFRQVRPGYRGRAFTLLKFRTMRDERDAQGRRLPDAERLTALGQLLRGLSLDELPQLWNVLRGDMSLVGPRPLIPFMLESYPEFRRVRAQLRPGITGLWQLRDRSNNTSAAAMLSHDLEYLARFGLRQDLAILLHTIPAVLSGEGAF